MMRKLAGGLRVISFIAHPLLRLFSGSIKLLLSSELIAIGFSKLAFQPCYGLAEATQAVTFDQKGEGLVSKSPPIVPLQ